MKKAILILAAVVLVCTPFLASAQSSFDAKCMVRGGCWGPLITCTGDYKGVVTHTAQVPDPANPGKTIPIGTCSSVCDIAVLLNTWIFFAYTIIVYALLPLGVAIGGFVWLTSAGNEERVSMARGIFKKTFTGLAIATVVVIAVGFVISSIGIGASNSSAAAGGFGMNITCDRNSILNPNLNATSTVPNT